MSIIKNLTNVIAKARALDQKSLEALRFTIFGIIIANIFGLWYLLGWKRLAAALLIFLIISLVIILLLERNLPYKKHINKIKKEEKPKMNEETETKEEEYKDLTPKEPKQKEQSEGMFGNMDLGLGNVEDYQDRVEKALGTF